MCLYASIQSNAIQCIVLTSQSLDTVFLEWFGETCAFSLTGNAFQCITPSTALLDSTSPFDGLVIITFGYLVTIVLSIPLGILNLDDNIIVQIVAAFISISFSLQWVIASLSFKGTDHLASLNPAPLVGFTGENLPTAIGTIMLSMAFTYVVPSWINLKVINTYFQCML